MKTDQAEAPVGGQRAAMRMNRMHKSVIHNGRTPDRFASAREPAKRLFVLLEIGRRKAAEYDFGDGTALRQE